MADRRQLIKNYFNDKPSKYPWYFIGVGVIGLFLANFFLVSILIGVGMIYFGKKKIPSEVQYDTWLTEDINKFYSEARKKTRLDVSEIVRDPVMMIGHIGLNPGGVDIHFKRGKDKKLRYTPLTVTIINFTEHQLVTYQTTFDYTTGKALNTETKRFFYKDVVSAETRSQNKTIDEKNIKPQVYKDFPGVKDQIINGKLQLHQTETFALTTKGGTTLEVVLSEPDFLGEIGSNSFNEKVTDQAINSINKMLLAKKLAP